MQKLALIHDRPYLMGGRMGSSRQGPRPVAKHMLVLQPHPQQPQMDGHFTISLSKNPELNHTVQRHTGLVQLPLNSRYPGLVLQPDSCPISQEQLAAEVKGIYEGLVMVEAKCINMDATQAASPKHGLGQWQALIALHRTLLYEHHDFLMATQRPLASDDLRRLADLARYGMVIEEEEMASDEMARYSPDAHINYSKASAPYQTTSLWDLHSLHAKLRRPDRSYHCLRIRDRKGFRRLGSYLDSPVHPVPFANARDCLVTLCRPIPRDKRQIQSTGFAESYSTNVLYPARLERRRATELPEGLSGPDSSRNSFIFSSGSICAPTDEVGESVESPRARAARTESFTRRNQTLSQDTVLGRIDRMKRSIRNRCDELPSLASILRALNASTLTDLVFSSTKTLSQTHHLILPLTASSLFTRVLAHPSPPLEPLPTPQPSGPSILSLILFSLTLSIPLFGLILAFCPPNQLSSVLRRKLSSDYTSMLSLVLSLTFYGLKSTPPSDGGGDERTTRLTLALWFALWINQLVPRARKVTDEMKFLWLTLLTSVVVSVGFGAYVTGHQHGGNTTMGTAVGGVVAEAMRFAPIGVTGSSMVFGWLFRSRRNGEDGRRREGEDIESGEAE